MCRYDERVHQVDERSVSASGAVSRQMAHAALLLQSLDLKTVVTTANPDPAADATAAFVSAHSPCDQHAKRRAARSYPTPLLPDVITSGRRLRVRQHTFCDQIERSF